MSVAPRPPREPAAPRRRRTGMTARTFLASAALAAGLVVPVAAASPAGALSCVGPDRVLEDAEVVYTGTVVDARDSRVLVEVEEVWRGGPVEEHVWLRVELEGWTQWAGPSGRIPDGFSTTSTWLFAPDEEQAVGPCTSWAMDGFLRPYVEQHRPAEPQAPVPGAAESESAADDVHEQESPAGWPLMAGATGLLAALGLAALLLARRRAGR